MFQFNFLATSACFEHHVLIIRNSICTRSLYGSQQCTSWEVSNTSFHLLILLHKCMKNIPYKTACTNGLPDDEHMIFETLRDAKELY